MIKRIITPAIARTQSRALAIIPTNITSPKPIGGEKLADVPLSLDAMGAYWRALIDFSTITREEEIELAR